MALHCERCGQENAPEARFCRHCGAPLASVTNPQLAGDPLLGQHVLGRYEVTSLIGEGGMGRVYAAAQRVGTTTRKVAVKTLRAELGADPQVVKRFYREAETIVRLTHPNTIQFFDFGELPDRTLVIVMEYIEGGSLADALRTGPLAAGRFDGILNQICGALFEAHQLGIVHRDLKPDNILLTDRGGRSDFVKVLDFGIAKISSREDDNKPESTRLTQQGMMVGTPPYMSPEQFSGGEVDARSDIYSLGVIAYEMLTGRLPFDAKTPWEWASKHLTAEPAPLNINVQTGISERRVWAIRRALSKTPSERQRDVQEFLADLTGTGGFTATSLAPVMPSLPATPAAPTPIHTPRTDPDSDDGIGLPVQRGGVGMAALVMCALCLAAGGAWWALRGERSSAPPAGSLASVGASAAPVAATPVSPVAAAPLGVPTQAPTAADLHAGESPRAASRRERRAARSTDREVEPAVVVSKSEPVTHARPVVERPPAPTPAAVLLPEPTRPAAQSAPAPVAAPVPRPAAEPASVPKDLADRVQRALASVNGKPEVAIGMLQAAASKYGVDHPALAPLKRALAVRGPARARELIDAGRCAQAQSLFRALRSAGLGSAAATAFGRSCPAPS